MTGAKRGGKRGYIQERSRLRLSNSHPKENRDIDKWSGNFRVIFVGTKIEEYVSEFSSFQLSELKHLNFQQKIEIFVCRTLYSPLSPSGHLAITDTPLLRTAAEVP